MPEWPADKVERWPVERLVPYARNAHTHSTTQVAQIAGSIREWGWTMPVLADVPAMVASGWTEAKKRAYVLADNKLALNAGWDPELLKLELADLRDMGVDVQLVGFTDNELADIFANQTAGLTDADELPGALSEPVSVLGDVWLVGEHRLACGDSTDPMTVARALAGSKPHLMATDSPYWVDYNPKWRARAGVSKNALKMGAVANDERADWRAAWSLFGGAVAHVWCKDRFALGRGHYHWQHERCWYAVRGSAHWRGDRTQTTVWNIPAREDAAARRRS